MRSDESSALDVGITDTVSGNKRDRQDEVLRDDFGSVQSAVLNELAGILQSVDARDMAGLARAIQDANCICCYGVNREGLALKAFTINLHNLGFKAHFVGDTNTPPLTTGDLFLVSAGPSYYSTVRNAISAGLKQVWLGECTLIGGVTLWSSRGCIYSTQDSTDAER